MREVAEVWREAWRVCAWTGWAVGAPHTVLAAELGERVAALHAHQHRRAELHCHSALRVDEGVRAPADALPCLQQHHLHKGGERWL